MSFEALEATPGYKRLMKRRADKTYVVLGLVVLSAFLAMLAWVATQFVLGFFGTIAGTSDHQWHLGPTLIGLLMLGLMLRVMLAGMRREFAILSGDLEHRPCRIAGTRETGGKAGHFYLTLEDREGGLEELDAARVKSHAEEGDYGVALLKNGTLMEFHRVLL